MSPPDPPPTLSLLEVYRRLEDCYGPQGWWPGEGPLEVILGAILTQGTAWANVELALRNLKQAGCWSWNDLDRLPQSEVAALVRPSGYFNAKARKLKAFAAHVVGRYGGDLDAFLGQEVAPLRAELLSIHGIGPETADAILVYAAGQPSFVIDRYTRRILGRLGLVPDHWGEDYHQHQRWFHAQLPADPALFNQFHALLDRHGKDACRPVPRCAGCCLQDVCALGRSARQVPGALRPDNPT